MFNWKNMLKGFVWAVGITAVLFLVIVIIFPNLYGESRYYFWGNAIVLGTFLPVVAAFLLSWGLNRRIIRETGDRYQKITWEHPHKIRFFDTSRTLFWIGIWGSIIYMILYAIGIIRLDIDGITSAIAQIFNF